MGRSKRRSKRVFRPFCLNVPDSLLRICRRRSSFEPGNLEFVYRTVFCRGSEKDPDLQLSVYEVSDDVPTWVRVYAEHYASHLSPPFRDTTVVNLEGKHHGTQVAVPAHQAKFQFQETSHRELHFADAAELRNFVNRLLADIDGRAREVDSSDASKYAASRCFADDPEWADLASGERKWAKYLHRLTKQP